MTDYQLRARIPMELTEELRSVIEYINDSVPASSATFSTITRFALKEYANRFKSRVFEGSSFVELPVKHMSKYDLNVLLDAFKHLEYHTSTDIEVAKNRIEMELLTRELEKAEKNKKEVNTF